MPDGDSEDLPDARSHVKGVSVCSTRSAHARSGDFKPRFLSMRARQHPGLEQDLEAVADTDDRPTTVRERFDSRMIGEKRAMAPVRR